VIRSIYAKRFEKKIKTHIHIFLEYSKTGISKVCIIGRENVKLHFIISNSCTTLCTRVTILCM